MGISLKDLDKKYTQQVENTRRDSELLYEEFKASLTERDEKQHEVLTTEISKYLVTGPAGSGKTIIAMLKAFELEKLNINYILIIYTKALKCFLEGKMRNVNFRDIEKKIYYEEELTEEELEALCEDGDVDYVIIDEVQDFPIDSILQYEKIGNKGIFLYGDNGQQVYPDRTNNMNIIKEIKNKISMKNFNLPRTYRVPEKIAKFAEQIDRRNTLISQNCFKIQGDIPIVIEFNKFEDEMKNIIQMIRREGWKNIGILLSKNEDVKVVADKLIELGLICERKDYEFNNLDFTTNNPKVMTYHSSKGLEFNHVFIPQCGYHHNPTKYNYREALFVAMTRAKESLVVSYITHNKAQYLNEIDKATYIFQKK